MNLSSEQKRLIKKLATNAPEEQPATFELLFNLPKNETAVTPDDNELRIRIYREAWADAERENARLREENERLREENKLLNTHKARYQEEILQLEQEAETYRLALNKVRVIAEEVGLE